MSGAVGQEISRVDGPAKVTGAARYSGETFFPMQDDVIHYAGQPVAIVVADSLEQAQYAATLVRVSYARTAPVTTIGQGRADAYEPEKIFGGVMPGRTKRGHAADGLAAADLRIDAEHKQFIGLQAVYVV